MKKKCPACGNLVETEDDYCKKCGNQLIETKDFECADLKEKLSDLNLKIEDINENLKVKERLIEMEKKKHFEKMEEKNKKVEQMKYEKLQYQNHRRQINRNLEMDKEKILNKYYALKLNQNRAREEILKELFPEDYKDSSYTFEKGKSNLMQNNY